MAGVMMASPENSAAPATPSRKTDPAAPAERLLRQRHQRSVPPSPLLSARIRKRTYLAVTVKNSAQISSETMPIDLARSSPASPSCGERGLAARRAGSCRCRRKTTPIEPSDERRHEAGVRGVLAVAPSPAWRPAACEAAAGGPPTTCLRHHCAFRGTHCGPLSAGPRLPYTPFPAGEKRARRMPDRVAVPAAPVRGCASERPVTAADDRASPIALPIDDVLPDLPRRLWQSRPRPCWSRRPAPARRRGCRWRCSTQPGWRRARIILLEPRRLAARAAAERMAATLGEPVGETVGLRVRASTRRSRPRTRIEVVTEGVFTRMILDDPIARRRRGGDLRRVPRALARRRSRPRAGARRAGRACATDLRLLVMSATLDGARVAALLGDAPVIASAGPRLSGRDPLRRPRSRPADRGGGRRAPSLRRCGRSPARVLVFLPGQGEIAPRRRPAGRARRPGEVEIAPLYGALDRGRAGPRRRAGAARRRKVVLATSIAETSLTIEGVRVVVDSGLARVPRYEPGPRPDAARDRARLARRRPTSAAAAPAGPSRASATGSGRRPRPARSSRSRRPEILDADLSGLVLDLAAWGVARSRDASPGSTRRRRRPSARGAALLAGDSARSMPDGRHHAGGPRRRARCRCRRASPAW